MRTSRLFVASANRRPSGLNRAASQTTGLVWIDRNPAAVDVPDSQAIARIIVGRQVSPVTTEAEDGDVAITAGSEPSDLVVVGDATDRDRAIAEPKGVSGHGRIEGGS